MARSGDRVGLRVVTALAEKVATSIRPDEMYVSALGRKQFQIGPIPYGTQRVALAKALKEFGWNAKPVQVVQSGFSVQGLHWSIQSTEDPPSTVLHFRSSEAIITPVGSDVVPTRQAPSVVAAKGTIDKLRPTVYPRSKRTSFRPMTHGRGSSLHPHRLLRSMSLSWCNMFDLRSWRRFLPQFPLHLGGMSI